MSEFEDTCDKIGKSDQPNANANANGMTNSLTLQFSFILFQSISEINSNRLFLREVLCGKHHDR
jgi:hypothetical protein